MEYSLAEIDAVSKKAARGAGFSWGLSEEAGKAVRYLCMMQLPGPKLLADYLAQLDQSELQTGSPDISKSPWSAIAGCLCPLATGAALADLIATFDSAKPIELSTCASPLLMAAITSNAAVRQQISLRFEWDELQLTLHPQGIDIKGARDDLFRSRVNRLQISAVPSAEAEMKPMILPAEVDETSWQLLNNLAFRTYVPSSAASRAGAGSSLSDND